MTTQEATAYLNSISANEVRAAATDLYDVAGADWDGAVLSLLRNGEWYRHSNALNWGVARFIKNSKLTPMHCAIDKDG